MARLIINVETVVVSLSPLEKLEATRGDVIVRRSAVTHARAVPDGMAEVHGIRAPGTAVPGVKQFDRLVVTSDDPAEIVSALVGSRPATLDGQQGARR